jgi:hypothetical protein
VSIVLLAATMSFAGCNLMVGGYSTGHPEDGGTDPEIGAPCTPDNATGSFSPLAGPTQGCTERTCPLWTDLCFSQDHQYVLVEKRDTAIYWYEACTLRAPGDLGGQLACQTGAGRTVILDNQGITGQYEEIPSTWVLYHRDVSYRHRIGPVEGCGDHRCEMFDGFGLDADHHFFLRHGKGGEEQNTFSWYNHCMVDTADADEYVRLRCWDASGGSVVTIYSDGFDQHHTSFQDQWDLYIEPKLGGGGATLLGPSPSCGFADCILWDDFLVEPDSRYAMFSKSDASVRWFTGCSADIRDPVNVKLTCHMGLRSSVTLQTAGAEHLDHDRDQAEERTYALFRWRLAPE